MKAVVFAYHDMGCTGTQALLEAGYDIAAIFTHPDAEIGRASCRERV